MSFQHSLILKIKESLLTRMEEIKVFLYLKLLCSLLKRVLDLRMLVPLSVKAVSRIEEALEKKS